MEQLANTESLDRLEAGWHESMEQDFLAAVEKLRQRI
jgi:hypothetical protein